MKRAQLDDLLREVAHVITATDVAMIGSQCVHAATDTPPAEVLMSRECDLLIEESDPMHEQLDAALGAESRYRDEHGTFVDTVSPTFPFLCADDGAHVDGRRAGAVPGVPAIRVCCRAVGAAQNRGE